MAHTPAEEFYQVVQALGGAYGYRDINTPRLNAFRSQVAHMAFTIRNMDDTQISPTDTITMRVKRILSEMPENKRDDAVAIVDRFTASL